MFVRTIILILLLFVAPFVVSSKVSADETFSIVSDTQTEFFDGVNWNNSFETFVHSAWPGIEGAEWIWKSAIVDPDKSQTGEGPITFRRQFNLTGNAVGTLRITADNAYSVSLDGTILGSQGHLNPAGSNDQSWSSIEAYNIENVTPGNHTLTFQVTNYQTNFPDTPFSNPAGLIYRLDLELTSHPNPIIIVPGIVASFNWRVLG
ncbi:MAG TPA: hypothetical protein VIK81_02535, partial [Patescibacteria group bacterium]